MSPLEGNLAALAPRHPAVAQALADARASSGDGKGSAALHVQPTPSGAPTAVLDGLYLHGRHDPRRDAVVQVEREIDPTCTALVVVGFGLGYGAEAARAAFPAIPLLVVEPDANLFLSALAARDLRSFLADPGVHFHVGTAPEALPSLLETLPLARPGFLRLRPALRARPAAYRAAEETIQSWVLRRDINVNTLSRFGRLWVRNLCRNMGELLRSPGVGLLAGLFDGVPALVVAGGPSLDDLAPHLPLLRERMLLVCVNTPLRACLERGIEPDFTVVVDPQYWASRSLDWTQLTDGVLVAEPSACPRVFRRGGDSFFLCSSLFPLGETMERAIGEKGKLGAGGSVSTSAWDLARLLGARPVYTAGLDLGFPGMRAHCRGTYAEAMWRADADRVSPVESRAFVSVRDIGIFPARSADGGVTATDRRMLLYKWWFENQMQQNPLLVSRTLSGRSLAIDGMPLSGIEEALAHEPARPLIARKMREVRRIHEDGRASPAARNGLLSVLGELTRQLAELEALSRRGRTRSRDLRQRLSQKRDPRECLADLDRVDEAILGLSARSIAGFLVQSTIHRIMGEGEKEENPDEVAARSEAMYEGIEESAAWQRGLIERALSELQTSAG